MPSVTGFPYFIERSDKAFAVALAISSSYFVLPGITAPSVMIAPISFFVTSHPLLVVYHTLLELYNCVLCLV